MGWALRAFLGFRPIYKLANLLTAVPFVVCGNSMRPALASNEYVLISRMSYLLNGPSRGDVVVLRNPWQPRTRYIKRIIGLPGEHVRVEGGLVFLDGLPLEEPYLDTGLSSAAGQDESPVSLDEGVSVEPHEHGKAPLTEWYLDEDEYFVLGDNRARSNDSRSFGPLHRSLIVGRSWVRYWPRSAWGFLY